MGATKTGGIRCVYHGWKFDADGNCLDMPNLPPEQDFRQKVHAKAYKVTERAGVIWVYMGDRAEAPPLPEIEATLLPEDDLTIMFVAARVQLAAGAGRRHRYLAFRLPACRQRAAGACVRTTTC